MLRSVLPFLNRLYVLVNSGVCSNPVFIHQANELCFSHWFRRRGKPRFNLQVDPYGLPPVELGYLILRPNIIWVDLEKVLFLDDQAGFIETLLFHFELYL